ncbi:MAG: carbohydrate kinase family protein [bacterium]
MSAPEPAKDECLDLVLIGHIVKEMIYFPDRTLGPVLGSPAAYGAVAAGRLGESVGIVSVIGTDMPDGLLEPFRRAGVDMRGLLVKDGRCTTASELVYSRSGSKEIRYPQKAPPIRFEDVPAEYYGAKIFYVATMDRDVPLMTIRRLSSLGGSLAIDLGGYGGAHSREHPSEAEQKRPVALRQLIGYVDIVRASVEDCVHLLGADAVATEAAEEAVVRRFLDWGATIALLTSGERGCIVGTHKGIARIPARQGEVIDTTGAGDTFSTAFLVEYMRTHDVRWSAQFGATTVIEIIERTGGVRAERMPTREEVKDRLAT